jgi:hypothetical protein
MMNARQHIEDGPLLRCREPDAVGRHDRNVIRRSQIGQQLVVGFLVAQTMPLQLDKDPIPAKHPDDPIQQSADAIASGAQNLATGQRNQPSRISIELFEREGPFAFGGPQLHPGDQTAQLPVSLL